MMTQEDVFNKKAVLAGLDLTQQNYQLLDLLIECEEDYHAFWKFWEKNMGKQAFAVKDFQAHLIDTSGISRDEFIKTYLNSPIDALQKLFKIPVVESDMKYVNKWFDGGKTLADLYEEHKKNPYLPMFRIIL